MIMPYLLNSFKGGMPVVVFVFVTDLLTSYFSTILDELYSCEYVKQANLVIHPC